MRLILIRHGETEDNANKICQGQKDSHLSEKGIEQAKKLGLRFKDRKIDAVYSSNLQRAANTAKEILSYHPNLKLQKDKRLNERYFGALEGKSYSEYKWDWNNIPEDVETDIQLYERVKDFLEETYKKHKEDTVVVVCHGGSKRALLTLIHNKPLSDFGTWDKILNTAVSEFDIDETGNKKTHVFNCTEHLN